MEGNRARRRGYRLREVAELEGMSLSTVERAVASGKLVAHRCGRAVVVFEADLVRWEQTFVQVKGGAA